MRFPASAHPAKPIESAYCLTAPYLYAFLLVVLSFCQLFTFDEFSKFFTSFDLAINASMMLAALITVSEVFALPFLLRLDLSIAMRTLSMFFSFLTPVLWMVVIFIAASRGLSSVGFLGTLIGVAPNLAAISIEFLLIVLAIFSGKTLWPFSGQKQSKDAKISA